MYVLFCILIFDIFYEYINVRLVWNCKAKIQLEEESTILMMFTDKF